MSWRDCIEEIRKAGREGREPSEAQVEALLDGLMASARRKSGTGAADPESIRLATQEMADNAAKAKALAHRNRLINLQRRQGRRERVAAAPSLAQGLHAEIRGINTPVHGGRFSAEAEWKARARVYRDGVTRELDQAGLFRPIRNGSLEREWVRELFELSKGDKGNPGVTGSREALTAARIFHKYQTLAKQALNRAGAAIGDYAGYITRTSHDPDKIRRGTLEGWKAAIKPLLADQTFDYVGGPGTRQAEIFLNNVWHALVTGVHLTHEGMQGFKDPAFIGPGNLARRLSKERVLHFKDADSWLDYHHQFGRGSAAENVIANLERSARATALMNRFGTNPRAEFEGDIRFFNEERRNQGAARAISEAQEQRLRNEYDLLDGTGNLPVNRLFARIAGGIRVAESMARLGLVAFTHLSVGSTKAAELRYQGLNLFERYANAITSLAPGRSEVADELLAGLEGMSRSLLSHFTPDDSYPGTLSKLANTFFRWSGLTYLFEHQRQGGEELMARHLGRQLDRGWEELQPESRRLLDASGITPTEWDLLRLAPGHVESEPGRAFLTPKDAERIPLDAALNHLSGIGKIKSRVLPLAPREQRTLDAWREDLAMRLYAMFNDRSEAMVIVPNIQTRAFLLRGTRPGTPWGEFARFVAQFKTWPTALVQRAIGRELYGGQPRTAAIAGILHVAVASTLLGYGIMVLKDLIKGRNPRDPRSVKTWEAALMQGGGIGILGDFLFGEYSRFGQGPTETLAGPVLGEGLTTVFDIWNRIKAGAEDPDKKHDIAPELFRAVLDNAPFINLLGIRTALNYLFLWQVQEALNPGSVRRMERRIAQQQHQTFWLSPTRAIGQ